MSYKIKMGDLVWAKVKGYPWWPGMVKILKIKFCAYHFKSIFLFLKRF